LAARTRAQELLAIELHVREHNHAARRLYRKLGFRREWGSVVTVLAGDTFHAYATPRGRAALLVRSTAGESAVRVRPGPPNDGAALREVGRARAGAPSAGGCRASEPPAGALVAEKSGVVIGMLGF